MKKILVVDDEKEIRELIAEKLKKNNYEACTAANGQEALKLAGELLPDAILMDVVMPVMDGYETCVQLKKNNSTKHIPVLFLTGKDLDPQGLTRRYRDLDAAGFIPKPSTLKELLDTLKGVLG